MAGLIKCPGCENEIHRKAESCPQCGYPLAKKIKKEKDKKDIEDTKKGCLTFVLVIVGILVISAIWDEVERPANTRVVVGQFSEQVVKQQIFDMPNETSTYPSYKIVDQDEINANTVRVEAVILGVVTEKSIDQLLNKLLVFN